MKAEMSGGGEPSLSELSPFFSKTIEQNEVSDSPLSPKLQLERKTISKEKDKPKLNIFEDESLLFHACETDVTKLVSIIHHGILSAAAAEQKEITISQVHGNGYNHSDEISAAESPAKTKNNFPRLKWGACAFDDCIKHNISFAIKNTVGYPERLANRRSGYADEVYISGQVPPENLAALLVPSRLLDVPIAEVPIDIRPRFIFDPQNSITIHRRTDHIINFITDANTGRLSEEKLQAIIDPVTRLIDQVNKPGGSSDLDLLQIGLQNAIAEAVSAKLGIEKPTLKDVIKAYKPEEMELFDTDGNSIEP